MQQSGRNAAFGRAAVSTVILLAIGAAGASVSGRAAEDEGSPEPEAPTHMSEMLRASIDKLVVIAGADPAGQEITGSYEKATAGLIGGMDAGSRAATISKDVGPVPVNIPIPILTLPATIIGGIAGTTQREIQEFRDTLTEDLAQAADQPLTNSGLASDVYFNLQKIQSLDTRIFAATTPVPEDTDAILYVSVNKLTIDVQGKEAILTTTARASLHRLNDNRSIYQTEVRYQDRDTLNHWTDDDNALWHDYVNFARHYLGREISAEVFDRVEINHELGPAESETVARVKRNPWQGISKSAAPTLAWELELLGGDSYRGWSKTIDASNIHYDVEIYDMHSLVYAQDDGPNASHTVAYELEPCRTYRWSVRPHYHVGNDIKYGEWMRFKSDAGSEADIGNGNLGRNASASPAYIQDFASLEIGCRRR